MLSWKRTQQDHQVQLLAPCRTLQESHPVPENVVKCSSNSDIPTTDCISMLDSLGWVSCGYFSYPLPHWSLEVS